MNLTLKMKCDKLCLWAKPSRNLMSFWEKLSEVDIVFEKALSSMEARGCTYTSRELRKIKEMVLAQCPGYCSALL